MTIKYMCVHPHDGVAKGTILTEDQVRPHLQDHEFRYVKFNAPDEAQAQRGPSFDGAKK